MAGPSIGVWVKVKTKSGVTPRVIPNKDGGGQYSQGQVITQSEFNELRQKRNQRLQEDRAGKPADNQTIRKPLTNAKGQGLLFDAGQYISPDAVKKERRRADRQIDALRDERDAVKRALTESTTPDGVARQQARIARIKQQISKLKRIVDGKEQPKRLSKGTPSEGRQSLNRDKVPLEKRKQKLLNTPSKIEMRREILDLRRKSKRAIKRGNEDIGVALKKKADALAQEVKRLRF